MNRLLSHYILLTAFFIIGGIFQPAAGKDTTVISYALLTETKMDTLIVARVGSIEISAREFLLSYEYGPAWVKRGKHSKERYLELMINEKLLALDGYSGGLQTSNPVTEPLTEIEGDLATEELFKDDVMSKVSVSQAEIENAAAREKVHISLKWLFTESMDQMKRLHRQLRGGALFDSLLNLQLKDSVMLEDRFLETTRFKLETKNPALSAIVDTLAPGKISIPIRTPDGWYVVKIVDSWTNAITTETVKNKLRHDVQRTLFKRKMDALSDEYVREMLLDADPIIARQTFDLLRAFIGEKNLPPEKFSDWNLMKPVLAEYGPLNISDIEAHGNMTLVKLKQGPIELEEFLTWYRTRQTTIRLRTTSRESFFISLQQLVWRMARDYLLVKRAFQRGLQNREMVKTQKRWWEEKVVYAAVKSSLKQTITVDDRKLKAYYRKNMPRYRNRMGKTIAFDKAKNDLQRDYYSQELNKRLLHRILQLKQQYRVEIYRDVLTYLSRRFGMKQDPKAIDVYVVKKGGTYPRPAFPVIDQEWIEWY